MKRPFYFGLTSRKWESVKRELTGFAWASLVVLALLAIGLKIFGW